MEVGGPMTNFIPCLRNFTFVTPLLICHPTEPNRKTFNFAAIFVSILKSGTKRNRILLRTIYNTISIAPESFI